MNFEEFSKSLEELTPPNAISEILEVLWHDAKGDWKSAHDIVQMKEGIQEFDRLHAYLHRKEGDYWNANYWYKKAKTTLPNISLKEEWVSLVNVEFCK